MTPKDLTIKVDLEGMPLFKEISQALGDVVNDERIDPAIREEYRQRVIEAARRITDGTRRAYAKATKASM
jgi:hypothetical protein